MNRWVALAAHFPTTSWWVGVPREHFPAAVAAEMPRMTRSLYGRIEWLAYGDTSARKTRMRREEEDRL